MKSTGWQLLQVNSIITQPTHWDSSTCHLISSYLPMTATFCHDSAAKESVFSEIQIQWASSYNFLKIFREKSETSYEKYWLKIRVVFSKKILESFSLQWGSCNLKCFTKGKTWTQLLKVFCSFFFFFFILPIFLWKRYFLHPVTQVNLNIIACERKAFL